MTDFFLKSIDREMKNVNADKPCCPVLAMMFVAMYREKRGIPPRNEVQQHTTTFMHWVHDMYSRTPVELTVETITPDGEIHYLVIPYEMLQNYNDALRFVDETANLWKTS